MRGGLDQILRVTWDGSPKPERIKAPNAPACFVAGTNHLLPGAFITSAAWTGNGLIYLYEPAAGRFTDTGFAPKHPVEAKADLESREVLARAKDGTLVPLSIVYKRGLKLTGKNTTLLTGYGSYGRIAYPYFNPLTVAWFEHGGVYAVAHVRGGGENGQQWHSAGQKLNKLNTWNDFIACAEYLIRAGYTAPRYLAREGTSAGGILIGRAITERPEQIRASIINVGMLDALRFETTANGVPNIQEFGTATDSLGFRGLYQMSAVHHVKDGTRYPAVLLTTGLNDRRVDPWQSAKMAARLQAASTSGKPILLRVDSRSGHGAGLAREQEQAKLADTYAFLLEELTGKPD
ncbi:prolyl oligopeptidase family serine peptidase [Spirosoma linguale]|uniref:prolyl oligopeptidase family serine peptidase n=1 Tax=Spirosoma linguale TaxID=108 RepID=UPI003CC7F7B9